MAVWATIAVEELTRASRRAAGEIGARP